MRARADGGGAGRGEDGLAVRVLQLEFDRAGQLSRLAPHAVEHLCRGLRDQCGVARLVGIGQGGAEMVGQGLHAGVGGHVVLELGVVQRQQGGGHEAEGQHQRAEQPARQGGPQQGAQSWHHVRSW